MVVISALLLSMAAPLPVSAGINSSPDYLRAYIHALRLTNEGNAPFEALPHLETGSPAHLAAFTEAGSASRGALAEAIVTLAPFTKSVNRNIAKSATLLKGALEERQKLVEGWSAVYAEMGKPDADGDATAKQVLALRALIVKAGDEITESAVAATWALAKIDTQGRPTGWAITYNERRGAVRELKSIFGADIAKGPHAGLNFIQTAAALFTNTLTHASFQRLTPMRSPRSATARGRN
jgi:hypothetical protein